MQNKTALLLGITLIALALLALGGNLLAGPEGFIASTGFHSWPLVVIGTGLLFCIPPFLFRQQRGLGGLFIPGLPVLATGVLLFLSSLMGQWSLWGILWPLEVIALGVGFVLAAIHLRVVWLMIPASIIGLTGFVLQFCAITNLWAAWAVLWSVVPFSVGLPILIIGLLRKSEGLRLAGLILVGFAGIAFTAMSALLASASWVVRISGPFVILLLGVFMVVSALFKRQTA